MEALADVLGIRLREAVGMIELLLHLADTYAPRGDIGRFSDRQIAKRMDWDEEPERLVQALVEVGWLDPHPVHRFVLHDWPEHAPAYTVKKIRGRAGGVELGWAVDDVADPQPTEPEEDFSQGDFVQKILEKSGLPRQGKADQGKASHGMAGESEGGSATRATPSPAKPSRAKKSRSSPPAELTPDDRNRLTAWAEEAEPWAVPRLREFETACLEHHRSKGKATSTDWNLNIHGWIRNHKEFHGTGGNGSHEPKPGTLEAGVAAILKRAEGADADRLEPHGMLPAAARGGAGNGPRGVP